MNIINTTGDFFRDMALRMFNHLMVWRYLIFLIMRINKFFVKKLLLTVFFLNILYAETPVSMDFQNIEIRALLQLLMSFSDKNVVMTDQVKGTISISLHKVSWSEALDSILQAGNLVKQEQDSVLLIMPAEDYAAHKKRELEIEKQLSELVPLQSALIHLHYAKAKEVKSLFQDEKTSLLSGRGHVNYDERTNSLWLEDIPTHFIALKQLIEQLDKPVKQVLIKAKIVTMKKAHEYEIGVKFGLSSTKQLSGTLRPEVALHAEPVVGTEALKQHLNFNVPATTLFSDPTSVGLAVAKIGGEVLLDLELSALEQESKLEVIASPHLIAAHQQTALIESGTEIPYQEKTSGGSTSATFKKAVMSMAVTPTVTSDEKIVLSLRVTQDKPGAVAGNGETIDTQHMETQVLVNNGETVVVGGINEKTNNQIISRVPVLGDLPFIGRLFQHRTVTEDSRELLIFITPTVIKSEVSE